MFTAAGNHISRRLRLRLVPVLALPADVGLVHLVARLPDSVGFLRLVSEPSRTRGPPEIVVVFSRQRLPSTNRTVYLDGSAVIGNGGTDTYDAQVSLYLTGTLLIKNTKLCAVAEAYGNCDMTHWHRTRGCWSSRPMGTVARCPFGDSIQLVGATLQSALYGTNAIDRADGHAVAAEHDLRAAAGPDGLQRPSPQPATPTRR
jgi:hypothetical protein